jgi:hypothetical protein
MRRKGDVLSIASIEIYILYMLVLKQVYEQ